MWLFPWPRFRSAILEAAVSPQPCRCWGLRQGYALGLEPLRLSMRYLTSPFNALPYPEKRCLCETTGKLAVTVTLVGREQAEPVAPIPRSGPGVCRRIYSGVLLSDFSASAYRGVPMAYEQIRTYNQFLVLWAYVITT